MGFEFFISFLQYLEFHCINSRRSDVAVLLNCKGKRRFHPIAHETTFNLLTHCIITELKHLQSYQYCAANFAEFDHDCMYILNSTDFISLLYFVNLDGPSADKLYANDQILKINDEDVRDMQQSDVIQRIK